MDTLLTDFGRSMSYDAQHYASNDSGLSSNSNGGEMDSKNLSFVDFHCDDLTKSLFMNSIGGNELIHDDDIYSYKNKLEIQNMFTHRPYAFNFPKTDLKTKTSCSFTSIIQDLENLKESEPLYKYPTNIPLMDFTMKDKNVNIIPVSSTVRQNDEYINDFKNEFLEKVKVRKPAKKVKQSNSVNNAQEYVSSSIKNYRGNESLNEIVQFIQGTPATAKQNQNKSKSDKSLVSSVKGEVVRTKSTQLPELSESEKIKQELLISNENCIVNNITIDGDSGTQSNFVSLNNSDEDTHTSLNNDFKEVLSKSRKKQVKQIFNTNNDKLKSFSNGQTKSTKKIGKNQNLIKKGNQKTGNVKRFTEPVVVKSDIDLLDTKDALQKFLSSQFTEFMQISSMVS